MKELEKEIQSRATVKTFLGLVLFIINFALGAFTTMYLWNNIMAYLFALPVLTWVQAYAVDLFITYMVSYSRKPDFEFMELILQTISKTLLFLFIGFVLIRFI